MLNLIQQLLQKLYYVREENDKLKRENQELKLVNRELEKIFESAYDEIFVTDGEGMTLRVNLACERHYGMQGIDLVGKNVKDLEAQGIFSPSATRRVIEQKQRINVMQHTISGRVLLVNANPVFDEEGNLIRVVSTSRDLTEVITLKKQLDELASRIEQYDREIATLRKDVQEMADLVTVSDNMKEVMSTVRKVAVVDSTVLLQGESGVGKSMIAKLIHQWSPRNKGPVIELNCGAIPVNLLESELFGYEPGAFTGARKQGKAGMLELAQNGTIILDEIGELPLELQVKLLRVIQEGKIMRIGGTKEIPLNVRFITATNQNLSEMVKEKKFRADLYYRLNVIPVTIPPLRERKEALLHLIEYYLNHHNKKYGLRKTLAPDVRRCLLQYPWPGNVRELENLMERLVVMVDSEEISVDDLPGEYIIPQDTVRLQENNLSQELVPFRENGLSRESVIAQEHSVDQSVQQREPVSLMIKHMGQQAEEIEWLGTLREALDRREEEIIRKAYAKYASTYKVATVLGISQTSAVRKIRKYCSGFAGD